MPSYHSRDDSMSSSSSDTAGRSPDLRVGAPYVGVGPIHPYFDSEEERADWLEDVVRELLGRMANQEELLQEIREDVNELQGELSDHEDEVNARGYEGDSELRSDDESENDIHLGEDPEEADNAQDETIKEDIQEDHVQQQEDIQEDEEEEEAIPDTPAAYDNTPYCTQRCLRGLCEGWPVDPACPNTASHPSIPDTDSPSSPPTHALTPTLVASMASAQLAARRSPSGHHGLGVWRHVGEHSIVTKLTVEGTGYTMVAKVATRPQRNLLDNEACVYAAISDLQGSAVPVCLGLVDLTAPFPLTPRSQYADADLWHVLLLSYGGEDPLELGIPGQLPQHTGGTEADLEDARVMFRYDNSKLWSADAQRIMMVDFAACYVLPRK